MQYFLVTFCSTFAWHRCLSKVWSGQVVDWAKSNAIDFVVVGPEDPLTAGVVDELEKAGILAFGPNKAAAELEGSKAFMKDILQKYNVRRDACLWQRKPFACPMPRFGWGHALT